MKIYLSLCLVTFISFASCRDFYLGMFKKNDWLVAQDRLYKERVPYRYMYAKYGRIFKCKITYFRVSDRLGYGGGPRVQIIRGGLNYKYMVLKMTSPYNMPISVNIYVGCANKFKTTKKVTRESSQATTTPVHNTTNPATGTQPSDAVTTDAGPSEKSTHTAQTNTQPATGETSLAPTTE